MKTENQDISEITIDKSLHYLNKLVTGYKFTNYKDKIYNGETAYHNHAHIFYYKEKHLEIKVNITKYTTNGITVFIFIKKFNSLGEFENSIDISEYFRQYKKIDYRDHFILSDYPGDTFEEKLDLFFVWLSSVTDEKLIKIFKGEDWVEVPYDWGDEK